MGTFLFFALFSGFLTALCCIPLLIPGVRRGMQSNSGIRLFTVLSFGLIATLIGFGLITSIAAQAITVFGDTTYGWSARENYGEISDEIWRRLMNPLHPCYSSQQEICDIAESIARILGIS
ncbi:MAG: hypothetical protein R6X34_14780 [Chloroflexota bacterium]